MASAAYTLTAAPATIESDTSEAVLSNGANVYHQGATSTPENILSRYCEEGFLVNHGPSDVWVVVSQVRDTAAVTVATTGAQAVNQIPLPAGGFLRIIRQYFSLAHKTAAGTATLSWQPKGC